MFRIEFSGENLEAVVKGIESFLKDVSGTTEAAPAPEPEKKEEPKRGRRGRPNKEEEEPKAEEPKAEEKPAGRRRARGTAKKTGGAELSKEMSEAVKAAHTISEEFEEGEKLVAQILSEDFGKTSLSELSNEELEKFTATVKEELKAAEEEEKE